MRGKEVPLVAILLCGYGLLATAEPQRKHKRSIELSAAHQLISDVRLPTDFTPLSYVLDLRPNLENSTFSGIVKINMSCEQQTNKIALHSHFDMKIVVADIKIKRLKNNETTDEELTEKIEIQRANRMPKKPIYQIFLKSPLKKGALLELHIEFSGIIWETAEGLFKGSYSDSNGDKRHYLATHTRPNNARHIFPCFDEPGFKVPFTVSISRPKNYTTLFNVRVQSTVEMDGDYEIDHFETTPPMSTISFGFVISQLTQLNITTETPLLKPIIRIWAREDYQDELKDVYGKVEKVLTYLRNYWDEDYPLCKLDIVALPAGFSSLKPVDNWGLIVFKESDLSNQGYYLLAQELAYQWLGSWVTPLWWSDAHLNKALAGFLAASAALEIDNGQEFDGKWPMTTLYSVYYEFSKRYPHSRITGLKQEATCTKTELVLRMLNYTIGAETFKKGLRKFFADGHCGTFVGDNVWKALTEQAHADKTLPPGVTVNEIVESWIFKDRLPVVTVSRKYATQSAVATQKVYLRERPHDVPEQDKMLWWIPLVVLSQDKLNFRNTTPSIWLNKVRDVQLDGLPAADKYIIVNPEEIGPFPVNYDADNWNLLSNYLQTEEGRKHIPTYTRAKLLHDAWNLAYAGDLSFATAFNMTLFMKYERDHIVWNPVFTLIDHIGAHIDMSSVHKKFQTYVRILLTPLYEELGPYAQPNEEKWKDNLRSLARLFLCQAGYRPCIEEAQAAYKKWMDIENPDDGNPVSNQYICPVFKWGTQEEWEFGLQRVINFPSSRKQSERTYLLKCLVSCPMQSSKIERLLNITILEENGNFTENDIFLEFNMLSGGSNGYLTLFNFLSDNWDLIRQRFENKTNLWDNLIGSATGVFTTQEGYDMVSELYVARQGEFGSAEHIIEKSLRHIKEETKWSDENLPIIEKWLDKYLERANTLESKFSG
ncbi:aminopeptidase N [Bradysia coprophila]|uniref:aminopeptidase N n=1 Tax=Bradysia coprophila TaxID=38358 RepID=UPI00187DB39A|nr:aminopeptidase N [Bradysia coprophila]